jgi:hypothetical protein
MSETTEYQGRASYTQSPNGIVIRERNEELEVAVIALLVAAFIAVCALLFRKLGKAVGPAIDRATGWDEIMGLTGRMAGADEQGRVAGIPMRMEVRAERGAGRSSRSPADTLTFTDLHFTVNNPLCIWLVIYPGTGLLHRPLEALPPEVASPEWLAAADFTLRWAPADLVTNYLSKVDAFRPLLGALHGVALRDKLLTVTLQGRGALPGPDEMRSLTAAAAAAAALFN